MSNGGKALQAGDHHIILAERTVDDEHVSAFISATYDSHMLIIGIEHQIAGLGLIPRDGGTVGVLHVDTAAVAYDVLSIRDIVKYPIDKSAAVQSIGSICVGGGVAVRPYLGELAPAAVPAKHQLTLPTSLQADSTTARRSGSRSAGRSASSFFAVVSEIVRSPAKVASILIFHLVVFSEQ